MPQRKTTIKVACDEVQGEGSWVELRVFTHAEMKERWAFLDRVSPPRAGGEGDKDARPDLIKAEEDEDVLPNLTGEDQERLVNENFAHVLAWNWVDDDGEPLPQPQERPGVLNLLNVAETRFLARALARSRSDLKN